METIKPCPFCGGIDPKDVARVLSDPEVVDPDIGAEDAFFHLERKLCDLPGVKEALKEMEGE